MKQIFFKYQGAGNDFILIDNRLQQFNHQQPQLIARLCDRRFGIGGDGIMFLQVKEAFDFEMVYYNADGKPSSMCGNGGRCIVAFAKFLGLIDRETNFLAVDGSHYATISESGDWVSLQMINVDTINRDNEAYVLKNVYQDGFAIRNNAIYQQDGININFVEPYNDGYFVRTFERGVENETYACGTGVTAVALAMAKHQQKTGAVFTPIKVLGGDLSVKFNYDGKTYSDIFLEGPAVQVFSGEILI